MKSKAQINDTQLDEMDLTITFTMTVAQWRMLMRQSGSMNPLNELGMHIAGVLGHITNSTEMVFEQ